MIKLNSITDTQYGVKTLLQNKNIFFFLLLRTCSWILLSRCTYFCVENEKNYFHTWEHVKEDFDSLKQQVSLALVIGCENIF